MAGPKYFDIVIGFAVLELIQYVIKLDVIPYLIVPDKRDPVWGPVSDLLLVVLIDYALRNEWSCEWSDVFALAFFISAVYLMMLLPAASSIDDLITLFRITAYYSLLVIILGLIQFATLETGLSG